MDLSDGKVILEQKVKQNFAVKSTRPIVVLDQRFLPVDEPALASIIMTHDHAKDLCAPELDPLMILAL